MPCADPFPDRGCQMSAEYRMYRRVMTRTIPEQNIAKNIPQWSLSPLGNPNICNIFIPAPSCARRSAHRHSEGFALGGETENLLQIKQFSILRISKRVRNKFMYITTHLIDFITIILGRGGLLY